MHNNTLHMCKQGESCICSTNVKTRFMYHWNLLVESTLCRDGMYSIVTLYELGESI